MENTKTTSKKENETKAIAFSQIFILVLATIAFTWMVAEDIEEVSAAEGGSCTRCYLNTIYSGILDANGQCIVSGGIVVKDCGSAGCANDATCNPPESGDGDDGSDGGGNKVDAGDIIGGLTTLNEASRQFTDKTLLQWAKEGFSSLVGKPSDMVFVDYGIPAGPTSTPSTALRPFTGDLPPTTASPSRLTVWEWVNPASKGASGGTAFMNSLANIFNTVLWASVAATIVTIFAKKVSSARNARDMTTVAWAGVGVAAAYAIIAEVATVGAFTGPIGWIGAAIVAVAVGIYMLIGYQIYSRITFTYRPLMWNAPEGGDECYKCNLLKVQGTNENACSEYICQTYGKDCIWVNNATMYETCIQRNPNDRQSPVITYAKNIYGEEVFPDNNYDYRRTQLGHKIIYTGAGAGVQQCMPAFTPLLIAFTTDEPADCRVSTEQKEGTSEEIFSNMKPLTEGGASTLNHTLQLNPMVLMSEGAAENSGYTLKNNGIFRYYVKCQDNNGNMNNGYYMIEFCTQKTDNHPPRILSTSPNNNSYIAYGTQKIDSFKVYLDEPAECKWDTKRTSYTNMAHTFDKCYTNLNNLLDGQFGCNTSLNGAFVYGNNNYYVACVDKPGETERHVGSPELIVFRGTRRLIIGDIKISGKANGTTISDSEEPIQVDISVETYGGAEDGKAICAYSKDGKTFSMFNNDGVRDYLTTNTETLYLTSGIYPYSIYCEDIAGNLNSTLINFTVKVDTLPPTIVRIYNEGEELIFITDEEAECVYSVSNCIYEFEEGNAINTEDGFEHSLEWDPEKSFYVKCKDKLDMAPSKAECSIEVKAFEISKQY